MISFSYCSSGCCDIACLITFYSRRFRSLRRRSSDFRLFLPSPIIGDDILSIFEIFFRFPGHILITFPFNLVFSSPYSLTSALLLMSDDSFNFPFFLFFNKIWWRMREIWSMNIVFFIRRKQSRMEGRKHLPFLWQFKSICDRSELLQHLEWSFMLRLYLLIIREHKVGSFYLYFLTDIKRCVVCLDYCFHLLSCVFMCE